MSYGNIYRAPPQPVQQIRYVPIPAQGDQPPKRTHHAVMALVLQSWPTGLEHQPQQRHRKVPPLVIAYGDQPPKRTYANLPAAEQRWWEEPEPLPKRLALLPQGVPIVVDNPPPNVSAVKLALLRGWWEPPDPQPQRFVVTVTASFLTPPDPYRPHRADEVCSERPRIDEECAAPRGRGDEDCSQRTRPDG